MQARSSQTASRKHHKPTLLQTVGFRWAHCKFQHKSSLSSQPEQNDYTKPFFEQDIAHIKNNTIEDSSLIKLWTENLLLHTIPLVGPPIRWAGYVWLLLGNKIYVIHHMVADPQAPIQGLVNKTGQSGLTPTILYTLNNPWLLRHLHKRRVMCQTVRAARPWTFAAQT